MVAKIRRFIYFLSIGLLSIFSAYILFCSFNNLDYADYLFLTLKQWQKPVLLISLAFMLLLAVIYLFRIIDRQKLKTQKLLMLFFGGFILIMQLFVVFVIGASLRGDTLYVFDQAVEMLSTKTMSDTAVLGYFTLFSNNIFPCIYEYLFLRLGSFFGLNPENYMIFIGIINVIHIDIALIFAVKIVSMLKGRETALKFMLLCMINPILIAYSTFVYTHTFSMPYVMGVLLSLIYAERSDKHKRYIFTGLAVFCACMGFKMRPTAIITIIAIVVYEIVRERDRDSKMVLEAVRHTGIALITATAVFLSISAISNTYVKFDYSKTAYPPTHWIMMGAQGNGGFNSEDYIFTDSFETREEKIEANISEIKNRIKKLGITGSFELAKSKLKVTWSDGIDDSIDNLSASKKFSKMTDYITGSQKDIFVVYCHVFHTMLMLLFTVSVCGAFLKKRVSLDFVLYLNVLGGMLFHILWETGEAYSICFTFFIIILAADGLELICSGFDKLYSNKIIKISAIALGAVCTLITAVFFVGGYKTLTKDIYSKYPMAVSQDWQINDSQPFLSDGELVQTFKTSRQFNRIGVKLRNMTGENNDSQYLITLSDKNNNIITESDINAVWAFDNDFYRIEFDNVIPEGEEEYTIHITAKKADEANNLIFLKYNTGNWKLYRNGYMLLNGEETNGSLCFQVYMSEEGTFMSAKLYILLAIIVLGAELCALMLLIKDKTYMRNGLE